MTPREALAKLTGAAELAARGDRQALDYVATLRATLEDAMSALEDRMALDEPPAFVGTVDEFEAALANPDRCRRGVTACDGCLHGWPVVPCAVTGAPVHRGPDYSTDCRQPEPTDEEVERVARYLCGEFYEDVAQLGDVAGHERKDWRRLARAAIAAGLDPRRVP
jgi:hypothetical protein